MGNGRYYTERNFSFGEIVVLNMLYDLHLVQNGSLVLIDELELALHPSAQIKLLTCLKEMASDKGLTMLITTHSASLIRSQKDVILLEETDGGNVSVMYHCPPAKAIGAIGMREDTMPDIVALVEDDMAKALLMALKNKYIERFPDKKYLDIRFLEIGGYQNVISFFSEANNYVFYDNVYLIAYMDKDVETDIIPYPQYGNQKYIDIYNENCKYMKFLPYTPEVLLAKMYTGAKRSFIAKLKDMYSNQQLDYSVSQLDFSEYEDEMPEFENQCDYNSMIGRRGSFRKQCKDVSESVAQQLADQLNTTIGELYRFSFDFAINHYLTEELNVCSLLAPMMKRIR